MTSVSRKLGKKKSPARTDPNAGRLAAKAQPFGRGAELREQVFQQLPAATWNLVRQVDTSRTYAQIVEDFRVDHCAGIDARGAACALQRLAHENGLRSWCYEFGAPEVFTHVVTLIEEGEAIYLHDAYLGLWDERDLLGLLDDNDTGFQLMLIGGGRSRGYIVDPEFEDDVARNWLKIGDNNTDKIQLQVENGEPLLIKTNPGYRSLLDREEAAGASLSTLADMPVSLLGFLDSSHDPHHLSELLGLSNGNREPVSALDRGPSKKVGRIDTRRAANQARLAQDQVGRIFDELVAERRRLVAEFEEMRGRNAELRAEAKIAQVESERVRHSQAVAEDEVERLNKRLLQMRAEVDDAHSEKERLQTDLKEAAAAAQGQAAEELRAELESIQVIAAQEVAAYAAKIHQRDRNLNALSSELEKVRAEAKLAQTEVEEARQSQAVAEDEVERLGKRLAQMRAEVDDAHAEKEKIQTDLRETEQRSQRLSEEVKAAEIKAEKFRQQFEAAEAAAGELRSELENARVIAAQEVAAYAAKIHQRDRNINALSSELEKLRSDLQTRSQSVEELRSELKGAWEECKSIAQLLNEQVNDFRSQVQDQSAAADKLRSELEAVRQESRFVEQALQEAELREQEHAEKLSETLIALGNAQAAYEEIQRSPWWRRLLRPHSDAPRPQIAGPASSDTLEALEVLPLMYPGSSGTKTDEGAIKTGSGGGCLCYGPYLDLAAGRYRLELAFNRSLLAVAFAGKITVEIVDGPSFLSSRQIELRQRRELVSVDFEVPWRERPRQVEFRIMVGKRAFLTLKDVQLFTLRRN